MENFSGTCILLILSLFTKSGSRTGTVDNKHNNKSHIILIRLDCVPYIVVLMSEKIKGLRDKFLKWKRASESKGLKVKLLKWISDSCI